jgi:tRNA modification GTPase
MQPDSPDTIIALATPPGRGGVGILRLSGTRALSIATQLTTRRQLTPRYAHSCKFYAQDKSILDSGLVLYFPAPHSFTGEDVIELHAHGSPIVLHQLTQVCLALGARLAKPGEFSERAFLNEKIDLTQAEAIAGLIEATTETAARLATKTLQGEFSKQITSVNRNLVTLRLYVEAAIDFPEEEIDFLNDGHIVNALVAVMQDLHTLINQAQQGVLWQEGATIVIAGQPNAGKSTLMNALARADIAIVTDIAGTTRDLMREQVLLDDMPLCLIDTAGLRETTDPIEQMGIQRAWQAIERADGVLFVIDSAHCADSVELDSQLRAKLPAGVPIIRVMNKIDTTAQAVPCVDDDTVYLSAKHGLGLDELKQVLKRVLGYSVAEQGVFFARLRHVDALKRAYGWLLQGHTELTAHRALELLADDLNRAHQCLCQITGEFTSDDLLGEIFSSFCIGK